MPVYAITAAILLSFVQGLPKLVELALYVFVGVAWIFPLKPLFLGVGRADPDEATRAPAPENTAPENTAPDNGKAPR